MTATAEADAPVKGATESKVKIRISATEYRLLGEHHKKGRFDQLAELLAKLYRANKDTQWIEGALHPDVQTQLLTPLLALFGNSKWARNALTKLWDEGDRHVRMQCKSLQAREAAVPSRAFVEEALAVGELFRPAREARERAAAETERLAAERKRQVAYEAAQAALPAWMRDRSRDW